MITRLQRFDEHHLKVFLEAKRRNIHYKRSRVRYKERMGISVKMGRGPNDNRKLMMACGMKV